ncbi:DUF4878 domain-containing protein [Ferruginibacter lapsinanis]|uniref:DUF4878 domain-containing protein n=1 Tax=Ferruginibacter lapsinanis TaxID=563172 RepID=UPI001E2A3D21|nr:DUF4878 domain-containing protein [Ferruginibacter lapsinanis]UEG48696.1 DUF4878 domain-containing protein [Ferruginibacter lapsinanis]
MKKLLMAIAILSSALFITSCKSGSGDPKGVLISFFDALSKKDIDGARKLATTDSKSMLDMMEMGIKMAKDSKEADSKYDKTKMEFGEPKIEGDKATIEVKNKEKNESTNFILKKEDGAWKVAFDKASMMQMGMEKMKEKSGEGMDSLNNSMPNMKDVNMDSLNQAMEKGLKALDSAKNLLKDLKTQ